MMEGALNQAQDHHHTGESLILQRLSVELSLSSDSSLRGRRRRGAQWSCISTIFSRVASELRMKWHEAEWPCFRSHPFWQGDWVILSPCDIRSPLLQPSIASWSWFLTILLVPPQSSYGPVQDHWIQDQAPPAGLDLKFR